MPKTSNESCDNCLDSLLWSLNESQLKPDIRDFKYRIVYVKKVKMIECSKKTCDNESFVLEKDEKDNSSLNEEEHEESENSDDENFYINGHHKGRKYFYNLDYYRLKKCVSKRLTLFSFSIPDELECVVNTRFHGNDDIHFKEMEEIKPRWTGAIPYDNYLDFDKNFIEFIRRARINNEFEYLNSMNRSGRNEYYLYKSNMLEDCVVNGIYKFYDEESGEWVTFDRNYELFLSELCFFKKTYEFYKNLDQEKLFDLILVKRNELVNGNISLFKKRHVVNNKHGTFNAESEQKEEIENDNLDLYSFDFPNLESPMIKKNGKMIKGKGKENESDNKKYEDVDTGFNSDCGEKNLKLKTKKPIAITKNTLQEIPSILEGQEGFDWAESEVNTLSDMNTQQLIELVLENLDNRKIVDYVLSVFDSSQMKLYFAALESRRRHIFDKIKEEGTVRKVLAIEWTTRGPFSDEYEGFNCYKDYKNIDASQGIKEEVDYMSDIEECFDPEIYDEEFIDNLDDVDEFFDFIGDVNDQLSYLTLKEEFLQKKHLNTEAESEKQESVSLSGESEDSLVIEDLASHLYPIRPVQLEFAEVEEVCLTCFEDNTPNIFRLQNMLKKLKGANFGLFNFDCLSSMYQEFCSCVKEFGLTYHTLDNDNYYNSAFEECVKEVFHFRHDVYNLWVQNCFIKYFPVEFSVEKTFSEIFNISDIGNRTPDVIYNDEDRKLVIIIETSVTSDETKTLMQKGVDAEKSKYDKEIAILRGNNYDVHYFVNYLDVRTGSDGCAEILDGLEQLGVNFLINECKMLHDMCKKLILLNRGFERFGYIVFGDEINWSDQITSVGNSTVDIFLKKIDVEQHFSNQVLIKMNLQLYNYIISYREKLLNELFSKKFEYGKCMICVTNKDVFIIKDEKGVSGTILMNNLNSINLYKLIGYIKWIGKNKTEKQVTNIGPYHYFRTSQVRQEEHRKNEHEHISLVDETFSNLVNRSHKTKSYVLKEAWKIEEAIKAINVSKEKMLSSFKVDEESLAKAGEEYKKSLVINEIHNPKSMFTLPFVNVTELQATSDTISEFLFTKTSTYTLIYKKFLEGKHKNRTRFPQEITNQIQVLNKKYTILMKNKCKELGLDYLKFNDLIKILFKKGGESKTINDLNEIKEKMTELNREGKKNAIKEQGGYVRLGGYEINSIKAEYEWINKKMQGINRGFSDDIDLNKVDDLVKCCIQYLITPNLKNLDNEQLNEYKRYINTIGDDSPGMRLLKENLIQENAEFIDKSFSLNVLNMSDFVTKFIYTLCYFSKIKSKGNRFYYSNLGYKNTNLFVRGGKSINKIGDSRQFRISFPIPLFVYENRELFYSHSHSFVYNDNNPIILSPWMNLNEKVLADMIGFKSKVLYNLIIYNSRISRDIEDDADLTNIGFNLLLCFNNRRGTENMLSDLRYPIVNSLSNYSGIIDMMKSIASNSSDMLQYFIRCKFKNYQDFSIKLRQKYMYNDDKVEAYNIFTDKKIQSMTDFSFLLYCTYMMTKAPYKQHIEQAKNLEGMMKIHDYYCKTISNSLIDCEEMLEKTIQEDGNKIFDNDFYFSPKYCFSIGRNFSERILSEGRSSDISNDFYTTFTQGWYTIENESGLRSDHLTNKGDDRFFGRKSHEVVAKEMINLLKEMNPEEALNNIKNNMSDLFKKSKDLKSYDVTFVEMINNKSKKFDKFLFHVVDKTQWKGGREIYVMTLTTKLFLNPLEAFFKKLCQKTENEIISVPSNRRLWNIHSQFYDNKFMKSASENFKRINLTLDCRKWGPETNFNKYLYFLLGMSGTLPIEIIELFAFVVNKYVGKEIIISKKASNVFLNNEKYKEYKNYFLFDENLETSKFNMQYSFVMGIFNYLSSLFHAEGQTYNIRLINEYILQKYDLDVFIRMNAHSDDSGGYMLIPINNFTKDKENFNRVIEDCLSLYEAMFKFGNIFLSVKKCNISPCYFELLSILYLNDNLIPMVPKFTGSLVLHPKMEGFATDMTEGYSKCIELLTNGATFSEGYLGLRIFSHLVRSFYHLTNEDHDRPVSCYGGLYSHPLLILLTGSKSDNIRLYISNKEKFSSFQSSIMALTGQQSEGFTQTGLKANKKLIINRRSVQEIRDEVKRIYGNWIVPKKDEIVGFKNGIEEYWNLDYNVLDFLVDYVDKDQIILKNILNGAIVKLIIPDCVKITCNLDLQNFLTRMISFTNKKLNDSTFLNSLNYVSNMRRLTETYTMASDIMVSTTIGMIKQKEAPFLIQALVTNDQYELKIKELIDLKKETNVVIDKLFGDVLGEAEALYVYLGNTVKGMIKINTTKSNVKVKPSHLDIRLNVNAFTFKDDPDKIYYSDSECKWMMGSIRDFYKQKKFIMSRLSNLGLNCEDKENFVQYSRILKKSAEKELYSYSYVESGNREINDFLGLTNLIETNSHYRRKIKKIFKDQSYQMSYAKFHENLDPKFRESMNLISIAYNIEKNYGNSENLVYKGEKYKHWIIKNSGFFSSTIILNNEEDLRLGECYWYYSWLRPQRYFEGKWLGSGKLLIIGMLGIWLAEIEKNIVVNVSTNVKFDLLENNEEFQLILNFLNVMKLKIINRISNNLREKVVTNMYNPMIKDECETDEHLFKIIHSTELDYYLDLDVNFSQTWVFNSFNLEFKHVAIEFPLDLNYDELQGLPDMMLNLSNKDVIDSEILPLIKKFPDPPIYHGLIKNKIELDDYNLSYQLQEFCAKEGLKYESLNDIGLEKILELNINNDLLPLDLKNAVYNIDFYNNTSKNPGEFISSIIKFYKNVSSKSDWQMFMNKWGITPQTLNGLELKSHNVEWIKDMHWLSRSFKELSQTAVYDINEAIIKCSDKGFTSLLVDPDLAEFQQLHNLNTNFLKCFLYILKFEAQLQHYQNKERFVFRLSSFFVQIITIIFENDYFFSVLKKSVKQNLLLKDFPIDQDRPDIFAVSYLTLLSSFGDKCDSTFVNLDFFNSFERSIRMHKNNEELKEINLINYSLNDNTTKHRNLTFNLFELPKIIKIKTNSKSKNKKLDKNDENNNYCIIKINPKTLKYKNIILHPNINKVIKVDEKLEKEMITTMKDLFLNSNDELFNYTNEYISNNENKVENFKPVVGNSNGFFEVPLFRFIGSPLIASMRNSNNSFIMICTALPADINLFRDDVKIYYHPMLISECDIANNLLYLITYRISVNFSTLLGLKSTRNFFPKKWNDMSYDFEKGIFKENYIIKEGKDLIGIQAGIADEHLHNCESMMYDTNKKTYLECFINYIKENFKTSVKEMEGIKRMLFNKEFDKKDSIDKMRDLTVMKEYIKNKISENKENEDLSEIKLSKNLINLILKGEQSVLDNIKKETLELGEELLSSNKNVELKSYRTNTYSPVDKKTVIYNNLQTIFKDKTDKIINRGLSLSKKNKQKLFRNLESQRLLYNEMYDKFMIDSDTIKRIRIFIGWLRKVIKDSLEVDSNDDFKCIDEILSDLDDELMIGVDTEKLMSDKESDYEYI